MISIIVPIYNVEQYVRGCVESLQHQTVKDIEIVLVDDGSTDGSLAIAKSCAAKDKRIQVVHQAHAGQSASRNNGLSHAQGDFIAFVDADDRIEKDWCERHLAAIEGVDYVQSGYKRGAGEVWDKGWLPMHQYLFTSPCMRLYRREIIEQDPFPVGKIYEDVLFSMDLWLRGATCRQINYIGYLYTLNPNSTTSRPRPAERKVLFNELRAKARHASLKGKCIVAYTMLRLKVHFILSDRKCSGK